MPKLGPGTPFILLFKLLPTALFVRSRGACLIGFPAVGLPSHQKTLLYVIWEVLPPSALDVRFTSSTVGTSSCVWSGVVPGPFRNDALTLEWQTGLSVL